MTIKEEVQTLFDKFTEVKKMEAEFKMKIGQLDDENKALLKKLGLSSDANLNIIEILQAALK